ncbi:hypothetical protein RM844_09500 [Streptomyces sp. DSM 44915]|uniref:Tetratricopeptide repeat protein n=1 Tax=Streptomyces chisholmiae TaxID=3075540 RepID=A0ABU2JNF7_9ACTN|nr:hypothetical protein [Streptomyces sp. DSM 44915]MDT0266530.1 hypothetical protein [Streptomyces sp. DSM 44915]
MTPEGAGGTLDGTEETPENTDDLLGVRPASQPYGPRWLPLGRQVNDAARLLNAGRVRQARARLAKVEAATAAADLTGDGEGLDLRARALANLASVAELQGRPAEALRLAGEALECCDRSEESLGQRRGVGAMRVGLLVNRAQTLQLLGRNAEALADCERAAELPRGEHRSGAVLDFSLHNTRGCALIGLGRYPEAEVAIRAALAVAQEREPRLAGHAYSNLGLLAQRSGDARGMAEFHDLARDFHTLGGDPAALALLEENEARRAAGERRLADAERGFDRARRAYAALGADHRAASCQYGQALVAFLRTRPGRARRVLRRALPVMERTGEVSALVECHLLAGDLEAARGRFRASEERYLAARALCAESGALHEVARVDARRAQVVLLVLRFAFLPPLRRRWIEGALALAVPSALAIEALRHSFPAGPVRERWSREVAAPAVAAAMRLVALAQEPQLAVELVEHLASSATLDADRPAGDMAADLRFRFGGTTDPLELPEPFPAPAEPVRVGAYAAGALAAWAEDAADPAFPAPRFALPPRLRVFDERPQELTDWIAEAERRYGRPIRSDQELRVW